MALLANARLANATRAVLGIVRRPAVLNTRHSVGSVPGRSVVVYEVARGFSGGQEFATSINVANEDSVTGVTELGVQPALVCPHHSFIFQVNDNLIINPSLRYSKLERLDGSGNYFEGNIARLNVRYQFSNAFNIRLISQKNTFTNQFFIQPLVQWNPNPSTIFYFGGNQNTIEEIEGAHFELQRNTKLNLQNCIVKNWRNTPHAKLREHLDALLAPLQSPLTSRSRPC